MSEFVILARTVRLSDDLRDLESAVVRVFGVIFRLFFCFAATVRHAEDFFDDQRKRHLATGLTCKQPAYVND